MLNNIIIKIELFLSRSFVFLLCLWGAEPAHAEEKVLYIYQDADLVNHHESSRSIQQGIELAFDEINNEIQGYKIAFKYLDHRGNVVRSKQNYKKFIEDPMALAIYSGIHSPPLIKNRAYINENQALTLVPWAAGGPITRYPSSQNWIFRLSIDDTRAGDVLVKYAIQKKKCLSPHLLLENTPWGDSNLKSMTKALGNYELNGFSVTRFGWGLQPQNARILLRKVLKAGSDCVLLVANAVEGSVFAEALIEVQGDKMIPVISHWGIAGGNFHEKVSLEERRKIDLSFIQSCFAFTNKAQTTYSSSVFKKLMAYSENEINTPYDLKSAVGFIHAYDLTKLLIAAINQVNLSGDIRRDRDRIRIALENLQKPVQGLVKIYDKPYGPFDLSSNPNAHEALHADSYCMGRYGSRDEILIIGR